MNFWLTVVAPDAKSEFQTTAVLSQIATKVTILYQFLLVNYVLDHQIPQILLIFLTLSSPTESKQKTIHARKAFPSTESLQGSAA